MTKVLVTIELELSGIYDKGDPSVGIGPAFENLEIEDAWIVRTKRELVWDAGRGLKTVQATKIKTNLLTGLSKKARNQLVTNIMDGWDENEVQGALFDEGG